MTTRISSYEAAYNRKQKVIASLRMEASIKDVKLKKQVLIDFGISRKTVDSLFENQQFKSLRALDVFANEIIAKQLMCFESKEA